MKHKSLWQERAQQCQKIEIRHDMVKNSNWHDWGKLLLIEASKFQTYCAFQSHVNSKIQRLTDKCVLCCCQSNVWRDSSQLMTTAKHCFVNLNCAQQLIWLLRLAVVGSWEEPPNISLTVAKNAFVGRALNFWVSIILKHAVIIIMLYVYKSFTYVPSPTFLMSSKEISSSLALKRQLQNHKF